MAIEWFYARSDQQRVGPVAWERLVELARAGELSPEDRVWSAGLTQWTPAAQVKGLFDGVAPRVASAAAAPAPIAYYAPAANMPFRAEAALRGHARPSGDVSIWPLDDVLVGQWDHALKLRKKINGAAQLYRALFALSLIGAVVVGLVGLFALSASSARARTEATGMLIAFGFVAGFTALYGFTSRATYRSQRWAPLTMSIVFIVAVLANLVAVAMAMLDNSARSGDQFAAVLGGVVGMILPLIFAVVSWRAYSAIPIYLRQPAWAQELIVRAKL